MGETTHTEPMISATQLAQKFSKFVDADYVIQDAETQHVYDCDGLTAFRQQPMLTVLPETTSQVQKIMEICYEYNVPIVGRGAGTGLSAGATPHPNGVLLSLARFNKITSIDRLARLAIVQPGVRNLSISEAAHAHGLYYAPDPSSQIACSIGGNVAENAGGVHCLKYGLTVHNVLALKMVTVQGECISIGNHGFESNGANFLALIHGSEGLLGIITEITVKLLPSPDYRKMILAGFDDVGKAADAVAKIIANGIIPAGLEMMDRLAIQAADDYANAGYPREVEALLLCELDGMKEEVSQHIDIISAILEKIGATSIKISQNEAERLLFWKGRKAAFPAVGRISPDYYCMDGTIPRGELAYVLQQIQAFSQHYQLQVANVFHAGDGNLHPLILYDSANDGEFERAEMFGAKILELCVEVGGTITGEHGVGLEKINQMAYQFNDEEIKQFHAVKYAFDDKNLLNPNKAIPTLKRCQEYRALPR